MEQTDYTITRIDITDKSVEVIWKVDSHQEVIRVGSNVDSLDSIVSYLNSYAPKYQATAQKVAQQRDAQLQAQQAGLKEV
jgi:hypothetical protein